MFTLCFIHFFLYNIVGKLSLLIGFTGSKPTTELVGCRSSLQVKHTRSSFVVPIKMKNGISQCLWDQISPFSTTRSSQPGSAGAPILLSGHNFQPFIFIYQRGTNNKVPGGEPLGRSIWSFVWRGESKITTTVLANNATFEEIKITISDTNKTLNFIKGERDEEEKNHILITNCYDGDKIWFSG